ncbi:DUF2971 domain-containing protein [Enterobacter asburiae]|jgi:hypothetical protein|nr:DUF2971 domain-containing protein [Enterobacter asburiae]
MYKYLPSERIDILENNLICFNNPLNFNDPFEFNTAFQLNNFESNLHDSLNKVNLLKELPSYFATYLEQLPKETASIIIEEATKKMLSLYDREKPNILKTAESLMQEFNSKIRRTTRILSLTDNPTNILMWGHYAQSHSGFVIEFDTNHPFFSQRRGHKDEFGFLRRVVYQKDYPSFDPLQSENQENYFLIKSIDWEYEHEWRMLLPKTNADKTINTDGEEFDLYKIPSNSIKTIIFGCNSSDIFRKNMSSLICSRKDYSHVIFMQATKSKSKFEIELNTL